MVLSSALRSCNSDPLLCYRFQSEDTYHRFLKALQIACFVYIGAASGNWNPVLIQDPDTMEGLSGSEATDHSVSHRVLSCGGFGVY
jgi:hypothetical protein